MTAEFEQFVDALGDEMARRAADQFVQQACEYADLSPIERLLAVGFIFVLETEYQSRVLSTACCLVRHKFSFENRDTFDTAGDHIAIVPQMPVGPYTADFYVRLRHWSSGQLIEAIVECDGHDFHERTKEQARHDKARDRYVQSLGLLVLRYTGSEIFNDPIGCARSCLELLEQRAAVLELAR